VSTQGIGLSKYHGAENTFVILDDRRPHGADVPALARELCAPGSELGGADGLLVIERADDADVRMRVFNVDGSEPEMCGNGVRCVVRYLVDRGADDHLTIATLAGPILADVVAREPFSVRLDMGAVSFPDGEAELAFDALGAQWPYVSVSVGNPHAVVFVDDPGAVDLVALGEAMQRDALFPRGTNLHAVRADVDRLTVRHYERGVGLTRACGTGAVACAAAAIVRGVARSPVRVDVPGGRLLVAWQPGTHAFLTGPAEPMLERSTTS